MRRVTNVGLLTALLLLVLAGGCTREDTAGEPQDLPQPSPATAEEPSPSPEPAQSPTPEPTEAEDDPTTTPAEPAPELRLVGDDYEQVVRSYMAFRTWLFRHPDPELFDEITHPDCDCYIQRDLLATYADEGLRWTGDGAGIVVHDVEVVDDQARDLVHLQVTLERLEPGELVDADGAVHDRVEPRAPWIEDLIFVREDPQSPWRLRDFTDRGPAEEAPDA